MGWLTCQSVTEGEKFAAVRRCGTALPVFDALRHPRVSNATELISNKMLKLIQKRQPFFVRERA